MRCVGPVGTKGGGGVSCHHQRVCLSRQEVEVIESSRCLAAQRVRGQADVESGKVERENDLH